MEGLRGRDSAIALLEVRPNHVVVATETSAHLAVLGRLAGEGCAGTVLIEKPLAVIDEGTALQELLLRAADVGWQLRFHSKIAAARAILEDVTPVAIEASVGQHLAAGRPDRNESDTASPRVEGGRDVLRDFSDELDLVL